MSEHSIDIPDDITETAYELCERYGVVPSERIAEALFAERQQCEVANRICDAVIDWMVKHDFADPGEELIVGDVIEALDSLLEA